MKELTNKEFMEQLVANAENSLKEMGDSDFAKIYKRVMLIAIKYITSEDKLNLLLITFIKIQQGSEDFTEAERDIAVEVIPIIFGCDMTFEQMMGVMRS